MSYRFRITELNTEPPVTFNYLNVSRDGRRLRVPWPINTGRAQGIPDHLDALLLVSDLQGHADPLLNGNRPDQLVGQFLPSYYRDHAKKHGWPDPQRVGVVLAGDLFALPHKRGGLGETMPVWEAMSDTFAWCVGVLGNHDLVNNQDANRLSGKILHNAWVLDGDSFSDGELTLAGVGGIVGRSDKPNRRTREGYRDLLIQAVTDDVCLLVLHEAPDVGMGSGRNNGFISEALSDLGWAGTVVCGHSAWRTWYHPRSETFSVLNTEGRAVLLMRA